jgi:hypothetical protein
MLVAYRLAGLSALEAHYAGLIAQRNRGGGGIYRAKRQPGTPTSS